MREHERRYTEEEFALILRRTAEMQERPGFTHPQEGGLTLGEISAIAREVGLDPGLVARAAGDLDARRPSGLTRLLGGEARHRAEAFASVSMTPEDHPRVVAAIRQAMGRHGEAREALGSLEWHALDGVSHLHVTVTPERGAARVVLSADRSSAQALTWLLSILTSLFAVGITGAILEPSTVAGGLGLGAGVLSVGVLTARTLWATATRRFTGSMDDTLERLTSGLEAGGRSDPG